MTGMTGVTGPTAPAVTANNMFAIHAISQSNVATGAPIPLDTYNFNGTAIQPGPNGTIRLAANQQYYVDYRVNGSNATGTTGIGAILTLNGNPVGSTNSGSLTQGSQTTVSGNAIITTTTASNLGLRNLVGGSNIGNSAVSVIKLA
ncbi:hypothetical protein ACE41H_21045 [Paenibacillus enshidis]|uniref:BclA C-terminal domain-containing protein n=1 Tax=Paenibacillus enshidis TaxID=1458439 RepID=A0ABV5AYF1_9BACL